MEQHRHCPACGRSLAADAPHGLCPACLLAQALPPTAPSPGARAWEPPAPEQLDELLPEHEVLEFVGRGGMGAVYRARHLRLGRIVAIHDYGEAGELCYLVMEYVDGVDLRRLLQQGRVKPEHALEILPQLCAALRYAHGHSIVHRDIKPENILLDETGQAKITDFGLARLLGGGRGEPSLTASDVALGSIHYMAPEQLSAPSRVDQRADIYSLGVVLYEMLTGHLPLGRFPRPSEEVPVGPGLDAAVLRALEHDPERRFRDAEELAHAAGGGQSAPPAPRPRPAEATSASHPGPSLAWPALLALVAGFLPLGRVTGPVPITGEQITTFGSWINFGPTGLSVPSWFLLLPAVALLGIHCAVAWGLASKAVRPARVAALLGLALSGYGFVVLYASGIAHPEAGMALLLLAYSWATIAAFRRRR